LLLDTQAFIWWESGPAKLSSAASVAIGDPNDEVWLSAASVWEMVIKSQLGKLSLRLPLEDIVRAQLANGIRLLSIELPHVLEVAALPSIYEDPFDRLLIAQSRIVDAELVSVDKLVRQYPVRILW